MTFMPHSEVSDFEKNDLWSKNSTANPPNLTSYYIILSRLNFQKISCLIRKLLQKCSNFRIWSRACAWRFEKECVSPPTAKTPSLPLEAVGMEPVDDVFDDGVWCAGGGAETKRFNVVKIFRLKLLGILDKTRVAS